MTFFCTIELIAGPSTSARYGRHVRRTYAPNIFIEIAESIFSAGETHHAHHPLHEHAAALTRSGWRSTWVFKNLFLLELLSQEGCATVVGFGHGHQRLRDSKRPIVLVLAYTHPQPELKRSTQHRTHHRTYTVAHARNAKQTRVHAPALSSAVRCAVAASAIGNEYCLSSSSICTTRVSLAGKEV